MTTTRSRTAKKAAAAPPKIETGAEILGRIRPQRRVERTSVCLRADLIAEFESADAELGRLKAESMGNTNRLNTGGEPDSAEIRKQARLVRKIEEQIVDSQVEFTFQSLNKDEWTALTANHAPRSNNQVDQLVGYHREKVLDGLVRECMTAPTFEDCVTADGKPNRECAHEDCGTWQQLVKVINPSEWRELKDTANLANSGVVDPPKSLLASAILDRRKTASE